MVSGSASSPLWPTFFDLIPAAERGAGRVQQQSPLSVSAFSQPYSSFVVESRSQPCGYIGPSLPVRMSAFVQGNPMSSGIVDMFLLPCSLFQV